MSVQAAAVSIHHAATCLKYLNRKNIVHRGLSLDSVYINKKHKKVKVVLGGFDLALCLKPKTTVCQKFSLTNRMAPEIEAGLPHDMKADIWALG